MLDGKKVSEQRSRWQALNLGLPVVLLLIFGFGRNQWRKRKYARKQLS
jgi:membrane-anchored protein YejM (alkaline phosphatase superfamily)